MNRLLDLKSFFVFLSRNKLYTAVNLFGFSVSLMFVILLGSYIYHEESVDRFHTNKERIFRLVNNSASNFASPIGPRLKERYPEIEAYLRMDNRPATIRYGDVKLRSDLLLADSSFFRLFSYELLEGEPSRALRSRNGVLICEEFARKLFREETSWSGRTVHLEAEDQSFPVTIEGVFRPFGNSTLPTPDLILPYEQWMPVFGGEEILTELGNSSFPLYLMVRPQADLTPKLPDMLSFFQQTYWMYQHGRHSKAELEPLTQVYFSDKEMYISHRSGSRKLIGTLSAISLLIILFAVINYINLSVVQTEFRAREMATRRLLGSSRGALFGRMIRESTLLCLLSFGLAVLLAHAVEPLFNATLQTQVAVTDALSGINLLWAAIALLALGALSGVIPATVVSRFRPLDVVNGTLRRKSKMVYNRLLIGFQYAITITLIGCTLFMGRQIDRMIHADLGFDASGKWLLSNPGFNTQQLEGLKNQLLQLPGVEKAVLAAGTPLLGFNDNTSTWHDNSISFKEYRGDSAYVKFFGFRIVRDNRMHDRRAIWLNQQALREMELPDTTAYCEVYKRPIAGILQDFHTQSFTGKITPVAILDLGERWPWQIVLQLSGADPAPALRRIEQVHKAYTGGLAPDIRSSQEIIRDWYEEQQRMAEMLAWFTLVAIVISALGILAMATYFIRQRSSEIAIRKVFGSTNREVLSRLIFNFVRYVLVAFVVAVPVIAYLMRDWLSQFTYRIALSWTIFVAAGAIALAIAFVTVFGQSLRAANTNPTRSLKK